MLYSLYFLVIC